jgi:hypothetical protein
MVAPTHFGGPRERRFVGSAGTAKPKAPEKEDVPLEDGPAESGENSAPGGASETAIVDTIIEENAACKTKVTQAPSPPRR